jgi:hypothetical protein
MSTLTGGRHFFPVDHRKFRKRPVSIGRELGLTIMEALTYWYGRLGAGPPPLSHRRHAGPPSWRLLVGLARVVED